MMCLAHRLIWRLRCCLALASRLRWHRPPPPPPTRQMQAQEAAERDLSSAKAQLAEIQAEAAAARRDAGEEDPADSAAPAANKRRRCAPACMLRCCLTAVQPSSSAPSCNCLPCMDELSVARPAVCLGPTAVRCAGSARCQPGTMLQRTWPTPLSRAGAGQGPAPPSQPSSPPPGARVRPAGLGSWQAVGHLVSAMHQRVYAGLHTASAEGQAQPTGCTAACCPARQGGKALLLGRTAALRTDHHSLPAWRLCTAGRRDARQCLQCWCWTATRTLTTRTRTLSRGQQPRRLPSPSPGWSSSQGPSPLPSLWRLQVSAPPRQAG